MKEPLNKSLPKSNFIGKSFIKHPNWYNQPLRLSKEQKKDPLLVLEEFFQSYHLNDVREIMWNWLSAAVSHPMHSFNGNDQLFFYERIEELVEVAYVIKHKLQRHRRRKEKNKKKKR